MKVFAVAFALLLASVSALPSKQTNEIEAAIRAGEPRIVTGAIVSAIEDVAQSIRDAGLDPFNFDLAVDYAAPVASVFNTKANLDGLELTGISNIVVNRMNYALLTSRLTFNIELPAIALAVADSAWDVNVIGGNLNGKFNGAIVIRNIVVAGDVRVSVGVLTGVSIRDLSLEFSLAGVNSALNLELQGVDFSGFLNNYLGNAVPSALKSHERDINDLLSIVATQIAESILS